MKLSKSLARYLLAAALIACAAHLQATQRAAPGCGANAPAAESAAHLQTLLQRHGQLVAFDRNLNGRLDDDERIELALAIRSGTWRPEIPVRAPGAGLPPADAVSARAGMVYGWLADYDVNRDGHLDHAERARLTSDIAQGSAPGCARVAP